MNIRTLVGGGDRIGLVTLPFLVVGVVLNIAFRRCSPSAVRRRGSACSRCSSCWSGSLTGRGVCLLLIKVPRRELITNGPYAVVKHPLYTGAALLVLPWLVPAQHPARRRDQDFMLYVASRMFAPAEEVELAQTFSGVWDAYIAEVKLPWL